MPYNQNLVERIRNLLGDRTGIKEKKMFGGVGFILYGNMVCGVQGDDLIVHVGIDNNTKALSQKYVRPFMSPGGKPMAGWILVVPEGLGTDQNLQRWVDMGYEYASFLPKKE
jgi:hypothetical protein